VVPQVVQVKRGRGVVSPIGEVGRVILWGRRSKESQHSDLVARGKRGREERNAKHETKDGPRESRSHRMEEDDEVEIAKGWCRDREGRVRSRRYRV
jgi:hypothetical protein